MAIQKELRLALVCYGGVSLAVYMHGITKELWKLLRASEALAAGRRVTGDTELVWAGLLASFRPEIHLRVLTDIIAGASAGGINGVLLGHAIAGGHDMECLRTLWLEQADVDQLLDPEARPLSALTKVYAYPIAWWAERSQTLAAVEDEAVREEMGAKLARFVRSRWFEPPFSGTGLTTMIDDAMVAMESGTPGPSLVPPTQPLDLFVTVTDWHGSLQRLTLHSPPEISETEHRRIIAFSSPPPGHGDPCERPLGDRPALVFAARATASFPGAFPPASLGEIDHLCAVRDTPWPGRAGFVARALSGDRPPDQVRLIDGSVLNNAPFAPAMAALKDRRSHREVDRRFVYIDPQPGIRQQVEGREPGFFTAILRALADIPREQPIRDNLEAIAGMSARIRRLRGVIDGMTPAVDAAIERAVGARFFLLPLTSARLAKARSNVQELAAREAGFAYSAYGHLKLRVVIDEAAALLAGAIDVDAPAQQSLRRSLYQAIAARGADRVDADAGGPYVTFLRTLDLGFRIRRLRFMLRRLEALAGEVPPSQREQLADVRGRLHAQLGPFLALRHLRTSAAPLADAALKGDGATALDGLARLLDLSARDGQADEALIQSAGALARGMRQTLVRAWAGFPFYDIALLPLMQDESSDSLDEIRVDRISPDDATMLRHGTRATLKGWQLNAFGAFFSRAYRENDYLWGRLHAAERLADIVASAAGRDACDEGTKLRLFRTILEAERPHLQRVQPLIDELLGGLS